MPLMLAVGRHVRNDMAGEGENSWRSILEARGFDLRIRMQSLASLLVVQQRFVEKAGKIV